MTYSLHTYDVGMFGNIYIPGLPLASIGISHWIISVALKNLTSDKDSQISAVTEIGYAMDHYLYKHYDTFTADALRYIEEQCICYYVAVENYFAQFQLAEHVDTPETNKGVATVFKD
ncbi:hypothetical protein D3C72_669330 [compost metagenome]